jgi:hypothetical protein
MIGVLAVVLLVVVAGARLRDGVKLRQQEVVLAKLTVPEAHAYYEVLRKRARQVRILRAVALLSIVALGYAYRRGIAGAPASHGSTATAPRTP